MGDQLVTCMHTIHSLNLSPRERYNARAKESFSLSTQPHRSTMLTNTSSMVV